MRINRKILLNLLVALGSTGISASFASNALAVPPASSSAELEKKADVIVDGEAMFVVCDGLASEGKVRVQQYVSTIKPLKWHKGARADSLMIRGGRAIDPLPPGPVPPPALARGWRGKLYLVKAQKNLYALVAYDAAIEDKRASAPSDLPRCSESEDAGPLPASSLEPESPTPPASAASSAPAPETHPQPSRSSCGCDLGGRRPTRPIAFAALTALAGIFRRARRPRRSA